MKALKAKMKVKEQKTGGGAGPSKQEIQAVFNRLKLQPANKVSNELNNELAFEPVHVTINW